MPVCAIPKGIFIRPVFWTFKKLTKMPWAVSGRKYISMALSAEAPSLVPNIKLNCLTSVQLRLPLIGSAISSSSIKALTSDKSSFSKDLLSRFKIELIFLWYSRTRPLVVINSTLSKSSPKRFFAFLTSFSIFCSILAQ